ncbi:PRC and DUF2382 domain-containing protein [Kineococcus glutinatus]|uniref:PRC and DUF2382 domain-containing protein n=1 Tax=Kineococcus glutinatus TaxID=1070872 RepID=A0ABP8VDM8_9ACTN
MTENTSRTDVAALYEATVYESDGDKIGRVGTVYLDDATGQPSWVTVKTGLFGSSESFVPLDRAQISGTEIRVPYSKSQIKDAPRTETDAELTPQEEERLYEYYGLGTGTSATTGTYETTTTTSGTSHGEGVAGRIRDAVSGDRDETTVRGAGHDTSGPNTDDAMTRSEEVVHAGTVRREAGRARLRKHIVTEQVSETVPVTREEVVVEREPITEANRGAALSGGDLTEEEHEVILHEEEAVTRKETVPVERVRLGTQEFTEQQTVTDEVRKEVIDVDTDATTTTATDRDRR